MKPDYTALDAAILEHIRSGLPVHPMYATACRIALARVNPAWVNHCHKIADRLQALRKAGKIQLVVPWPWAGGHYWAIVEEPTTNAQ